MDTGRAPASCARHDVLTPTLTGMGERAHLAARDVTVDTHVADIVAVLELEDVVLCAHSYGGIPVTGAADRVPERLRAVHARGTPR